MKARKTNSAVLTLLLVGLGFFVQFLWNSSVKQPVTVTQEVKNLTAFAKLYGYIKYFHPSDEAVQTDWDKFAIHGVYAVKEANNQQELQEVLESLFLPVAPTLRVGLEDDLPEPFRSYYAGTLNEDTTKLTPVAWQHLGLDQDDETPSYDSRRVNTDDREWNKIFNLYSQLFEVKELNGNQFKLEVVAKSHLNGSVSEGELFIISDSETYRTKLSSGNTSCIPNGWTKYEIKTDAERDIQQLRVGLQLKGVGHLLIDKITLKTRTGNEEWKDVQLTAPMDVQNHPAFSEEWNVYTSGAYHDYKMKPDCSASEGGSSLSINSPAQLFPGYPQVGETVLKNLGGGIWSDIPLALYRNAEHTLPRSDTERFEELQRQLDAIDLDAVTVEDENVRLANIIITWNIFQHFYPYFDVINTDWEQQLIHSLQQSLSDGTNDNFEKTWGKMLASLHDGHIRQDLYGGTETPATFPFVIDRVEGQLVVTHSNDENVLPGDIILSVDGVPAEEIVAARKELISGSSQFTRFRALQQFGLGRADSEAQISIDRQDVRHEFTVSRTDQSPSSWTFNSSSWTHDLEKAHLPVIGKIEEGIFYVNLHRASMDEIQDHLEFISVTDGVIFDVRGSTNNNGYELLPHLLAQTDTSSQWMQVPQIIYPDQKDLTEFDKRSWNLQPASPHIKGKVVFITDGRAISSSESFLSFVEHYRLGEIVGQPTAGTNGSINPESLPGGYQFTWTGMKVLKHDGSQHHLIGIQPTVPVEKTVEGIREGRDEFLEKAIQILQ